MQAVKNSTNNTWLLTRVLVKHLPHLRNELVVGCLKNPDIKAYSSKSRMLCYTLYTCTRLVHFVHYPRYFSTTDTLSTTTQWPQHETCQVMSIYKKVISRSTTYIGKPLVSGIVAEVLLLSLGSKLYGASDAPVSSSLLSSDSSDSEARSLFKSDSAPLLSPCLLHYGRSRSLRGPRPWLSP